MNYRKGYVYTEDGGPILPVTNDEQVKMSAGGTLKDYVEYSTEEKICGRWIDGKPIYRRVITNLSLTIPVNNDWSNFIPVTNIKTAYRGTLIIDDAGMITNATEMQTYNNGVRFKASLSTARTITSLIIEYTKTTD